LFKSHAYTVIGCYEVDVKASKKEKLIKIRNPFGTTEWKGDWGEGSHLWTKDIEY